MKEGGMNLPSTTEQIWAGGSSSLRREAAWQGAALRAAGSARPWRRGAGLAQAAGGARDWQPAARRPGASLVPARAWQVAAVRAAVEEATERRRSRRRVRFFFFRRMDGVRSRVGGRKGKAGVMGITRTRSTRMEPLRPPDFESPTQPASTRYIPLRLAPTLPNPHPNTPKTGRTQPGRTQHPIQTHGRRTRRKWCLQASELHHSAICRL